MGHLYNAPVEGFVTPRPPLPGGSSNDPLIGESLGGWRIQRLLGDDGYGRIYEAHSSGNTAALQVVPTMDPKSMDALERAIRAASAVDHPRVAWIRPIQRSGQKDVWFVRERLSGRTLRNVIKEEGRISAKRLVQLLTDAAEGLAAVHAARLYHGELSPDAFEFDHEGRLKVAGLGITVRTSGEPGTPLMGNPRYVAPEILKTGAGGPASDIYTLGLIAWELLTSTIPHETETGSFMDLFKKRFLEPLPLPPVQGACSDLLRKMLQLDPRDRHADGAALLRDLGDC